MNSIATVVFVVFLGYLMLWRSRGLFGATGLALLSYPTGLAGCALIAAVHGALDSPWSPTSLAISSLAVSAVSTAALGAVRGEGGPRRVPVWSVPATAGVAAAVAAVATQIDRYAATFDSWVSYLPMGMRLHDVGTLFSRVMQERALLLPAVNATGRVFGVDVLGAIYPVMALWLAAILAWAVFNNTEGAPRWVRLTATLVSAGGLVCSSMFLAQAFYVHSHMISALFLLMALACFAETRRGEAAAWAAMGGLATAAFTLARPDGFAYAAMLLLVGVIAIGDHDRWRVPFRSMVAGFWAPLACIYGVAYAELGLWDTPKLNGRLALLMLSALAVLTLASWGVLRISGARRVKVVRAARILLPAAAVCVAALAALVFRDDFAPALYSMRMNLFRDGGHGPVWMIAAAALVSAGILGWMRGKDTHDATPVGARVAWVPMAMLVLFMSVAVLVHGFMHPGHLGWTDSFNRIAFHATAIAWWAFGSVVSASLGMVLESAGRANPRR